jgi:hypothetical protein
MTFGLAISTLPLMPPEAPALPVCAQAKPVTAIEAKKNTRPIATPALFANANNRDLRVDIEQS